MSKTQDKSKSLTVFKTDRHEDIAAIILAGITVVAVLFYMAFIAPTVTVKADSDGKLVSVAVEKDTYVKQGDLIYTLEIVEKKWKGDEVEEIVKVKEILAKANGKVLEIVASPDTPLKKGKTGILVLEHEKGTLP